MKFSGKSQFTLALVIAFTFSFKALEAQAQQPQGDDVVSIINESPDHTIFAELLQEAQLEETLRQPGPFTILAPSDEAFEPVAAELDQMREDPQQLQNVMINHLFQGQAEASEVEDNFGIEVDQGDIEAANGVIHSIDEVLLER